MPLINSSSYSSPTLYFSHYLETIIPALFRKINYVNYKRERIVTPDDDFLDIDWLKKANEELTIICHGLEGSSDRPYMQGMAKIFADHHYDVLTWNFRGCSQEMNKQVRAYHSGATDDLQVVIDKAFAEGYERVNLIGFSLGGNLVLKYIGEQGVALDSRIKKAVVLSVPLHLHSSCLELLRPKNFLYSRRFLSNLKRKIKKKAQLFPDQISLDKLSSIRTIIDFDDRYTAPIHGFQNALHYYHACSAINFLAAITIPTLIINAKNDSFLSDACYPYELAETHSKLFLETPSRGGHCGFPGSDKNGYLWSEKRAVAFINS